MSQAPQPDQTPSSRGSTARTVGVILRTAAVVYLALVVVVTILVTVVSLQSAAEGPGDASFVGVYLIIVTLPLSLLAALLNDVTLGLTGTPMLFVLAVAGVIQAGGLWGIGRLVGRDSDRGAA